MQHRITISILATLAFLLTAQPLHAQLAWQTQHKQATAELGQERVELAFAFENVGGEAVTITDVQPSCGCTTAELIKKTFEPGEKGSITALFEIGDRTGRQSKQIVVRTDSDASAVSTLTLEVLVPELVRVQPSFVQRRKGEQRGVWS